jgi:hypothetical protein
MMKSWRDQYAGLEVIMHNGKSLKVKKLSNSEQKYEMARF